MVPRLEALIFDMDGVLADTEPLHVLAWMETLAGIDPRAVYDERGPLVGMASPAIAAQLVRAFDLPLDPAELVLRKRMAFRRIAESRMVPFDGLPEEIARWGLPRGLATSSTREDADFMLGRLGFGAAFAPVVTADDVRDAKPAPDCYRLAAERLGRDPGACVALEDTANGMKAALAAGIRVLAVSTLPLSALPPGVLAAFPTTVQALQWLRS